ncbi:MAG: RluA family pseudouridine synthase [Epulopiscium sp.]|nr:RluA family pseudouridine synthase [Candidatus Epulonipiscium sp.]
MKELTIQFNDANQRIDKFLMKYMDQAPKSFIYKMLRKKRIKYNNKKATGNELLRVGDQIQLYLSNDTIAQFQKSLAKVVQVQRTFDIVYEDQNILICNKPAGLLTHPNKPNQKNTLLHQVLYYLYEQSEFLPEQEQGFTPGLCNRLDRNTSGLIIVGKNLPTLQEINDCIQKQSIQRYYLTIVKGNLKKEGRLVDYYSKDHKENKGQIDTVPTKNSKIIETYYWPIQSNGESTLVEVQLATGRTHQIRLHLSSIQHPIAGDPKYGEPTWNQILFQKYKLSSQLLHGYKIRFSNIKNHLEYLNEQEFTSPPPNIFTKIIPK